MAKKRNSNNSQASNLRFDSPQVLIDELRIACNTQETMLVGRHKLYLGMYEGDQWFNKPDENYSNVVSFVQDENGSTKAIWDFKYIQEESTKLNKNKVPQRVFNKIQPAIDQRIGYATSSQPQIEIINTDPSNSNPDFIKRLKYVNSFLQEIFNNKFNKTYKDMRRECELFGYSPLCISYNPEKMFDANGDPTNEIPFEIKKENILHIVADPEAQCWDDVRWAIKTVAIYQYEAVQNYGELECFNGILPTATVSLSETWVRQDVLYTDGSKNRWEMFVTFNSLYESPEKKRNRFTFFNKKDIEAGVLIKHFGKPLSSSDFKDDYETDLSFPVLPIEVFRVNPIYGTWLGESSVKPCISHQYFINKMYSLLDWTLTSLGFPAMAVHEKYMKTIEGGQDGELLLAPGKVVPQDQFGKSMASPIMPNLTTINEIVNAMAVPSSGIQDATGISQSMLGVNPQGVYSAQHYGELQSASMIGFKSSENDIHGSLINLTQKLLTWGKELLEKDNKMAVYDSETGEFVELEPDDLDITEFDVEARTIDTEYYSPASRVQVLMEAAQYQAITPQQFLVGLNSIMQVFDAKSVESAKIISELTNELQITTLEAQKEQIMAEMKKGQEKPAQQTPPQQQAPRQGMQQQPQQAQAGAGGVEEFLGSLESMGIPAQIGEMFIQTIAQNGLDEEEIMGALAAVQVFMGILIPAMQQMEQMAQQQGQAPAQGEQMMM